MSDSPSPPAPLSHKGEAKTTTGVSVAGSLFLRAFNYAVTMFLTNSPCARLRERGAGGEGRGGAGQNRENM